MGKNKTIIVNYGSIERQVWDLAAPLCAAAGAELIDVEYVQEAGNWYLRIYIDRQPAVDHALCEQVSNLLDPALDRADPIKQSYYLEVSSPGLERPLKREQDFQRCAGRQVAVRLYAPLDGAKEYSGALVGLLDGDIVIMTAAGERRFPGESVAKVHLLAEELKIDTGEK